MKQYLPLFLAMHSGSTPFHFISFNAGFNPRNQFYDPSEVSNYNLKNTTLVMGFYCSLPLASGHGASAGPHPKNQETVPHLFCSFSKCTALRIKESPAFQDVVSTTSLK